MILFLEAGPRRSPVFHTHGSEVVDGDIFHDADLATDRTYEIEQLHGIHGVREEDDDIGVGIPKRPDQRGERCGSEGRQTCCVEAARAEPGNLCHTEPCVQQITLDLAGRELQCPARLGEQDRPAYPMKNRTTPRPPSSSRDGLGDRRLRHPQGVARTGESTFVDHRQKDRQTPNAERP